MISKILNTFLKRSYKEIDSFIKDPTFVQQSVFDYLINNGKQTLFGYQFNFNKIKNLDDFRNNVPIQRYENIKTFIEKILINKEKNVLWNSEVKWFAMSSGTTTDKSKYIPVTKDSLDLCHYKGGKQMLALYLYNYPNAKFLTGKSLVLGGSQQINSIGSGIYTGDISAVLVSNLPYFARFSRTPTTDIILLSDWEEKIEKITNYSIKNNVTSMAGVPSWILVLMKYIVEKTGKPINEVWPNLEVFFHGGVCFTPYIEQYKAMIQSDRMTYWETYNASEGFFGIQYSKSSKDMLLMLDNGVYYEFLPMSEWESTEPKSLTLSEIEIGKNYALIISTNGGLWRYLIGDTIEFTSTTPYLFKITGRTKHFINAFGEELIIDNAENALKIACNKTNSTISEYTAAPIYFSLNNNGAHEWIIEFEKSPFDLKEFTIELDNALKSVNSDYEAKRSYNLSLGMPQIIEVPKGTFYNWLKTKGKLGGQNKVPRLSNDRKYIEELKSELNK